MTEDIHDLVANIVSAYVSKNAVAASDLPGVIRSVYSTLNNAGKKTIQETEQHQQKPAVPVRRSVAPESITCLECGTKLKMLRRHLAADHQLTPEAYRAKWELPFEYPLTAPLYAAQRSAMAKKIGLGRKAGERRRKP